MLVSGKWTEDWQPVQATDTKGGFVRQVSELSQLGDAGRQRRTDGRRRFSGRKRPLPPLCRADLPLGLARADHPQAEETRRCDFRLRRGARALRPGLAFGDYPGASRDDLNGATYMHEIYTRANDSFTGRATVPVLWDKEKKTIVNNRSADIVRMLNSGFGARLPMTASISTRKHCVRNRRAE